MNKDVKSFLEISDEQEKTLDELNCISTTEKLFRFHRGTLRKAMETTVKIESIEHFLNVIKTDYDSWNDLPEIKQVRIVGSNRGFDERTGWNTFLISAVDSRGDRYVIGHSNFEVTEIQL